MSKKLFKTISETSADHEYFIPVPENYKTGNSKFIIIVGTVMSGLGKGIVSSSIGMLLQNKGFKVECVKFDGYLNQDAGTLNPFRHGEVFVLDDGTECDMDLGTYERFLNRGFTRENYLTGGKIFNNILKRERIGGYLGRDVQFIPHVTGEIKFLLRNLAMKTKADIIQVEVGGTVGDIENMYFIEAMRQLIYEEGKNNVCSIALTYVLEPEFLGEQKSKAAQLGIRNLLSLGIQPDIIVCRSRNPVVDSIREKISVYSNVKLDNVIGVHDVKSIYLVPDMIRQRGVDNSLVNILDLSPKQNITKENKTHDKWIAFTNKLNNPKSEINLGITGKYTSLKDSYASILKAVEHASAELGCKTNITWIESSEMDKYNMNHLKDIDGLIVPGGFGKRGTDGKIACIKYARQNNIPFLGLCYGMQMAVIEYARNKCRLTNANSTELDSQCSEPIIDILPEQKKIEGLGGTMRLGGREIEVKKGSLAHKLYQNIKIRERFRHRYEVNPKYISLLEKNGVVFSGKAPRVEIMQIMELPDHPFFIATQYHPEFTSRPLKAHPLFVGLLKASINRKISKQ